MPGGRTHDKVTFISSIPLGVAACLAFGLTYGMILVVAYVFAGLLFNGDLDHDAGATCYDRWWVFKYLFWGYMKIMPHRSMWSHGPILGTAGRLLYVGIIAMLLLNMYGLAVQLIGHGAPPPKVATIAAWAAESKWELIMAGAGLELGSMSHSIADWVDTWRKKVLWK